jgi:hypothetical protein
MLLSAESLPFSPDLKVLVMFFLALLLPPGMPSWDTLILAGFAPGNLFAV